MCSDFRRAESGTELLARLEGRSSLKELEPSLFADEDSPVHVSSCELHRPMLSSSSGHSCSAVTRGTCCYPSCCPRTDISCAASVVCLCRQLLSSPSAWRPLGLLVQQGDTWQSAEVC
ncbi:DNA repair protein XRCC2 isoform X3 [Rattus norvegicus]|uniref:DNA repair protein XRCC2 isoform X3 n=1 Tax=Rattus norvegicus TaxID=10116 RepID=UPI002FD847D4